MLESRTPEEVGISSEDLERAFALLRTWVDDGTLPGVSAVVARRGRVAGRCHYGSMTPEGEPKPVKQNTVFAVASITKAFTATAVMILAQRGLVSIDQRVRDLIPEFAGPETNRITIRHLLAHTSGLPEFPEDDQALRRQHQGLEAFVAAMCRCQPLFEPGTRYSYSNCGYGLLAEIVQRVSGKAYHEFVTDEITLPLGMKDTYLRPPEEVTDRIATTWIPGEPVTDYQRFNSAYFRWAAMPWGGLYAAADDLVSFGQMLLDGGRLGAARVLSPATVREMTSDHTGGVPGEMPSAGWRWPHAHWGLGLDLKGSKTRHASGDLTSPRTFGHGGSSGTLLWVDPELEMVCVFFANRVYESGWLSDKPRQALFSNAVVGAVID